MDFLLCQITDIQHANKNNSQRVVEQILVERVTSFTVVPSHCIGHKVFNLPTFIGNISCIHINIFSLSNRGAVGYRGRIN